MKNVEARCEALENFNLMESFINVEETWNVKDNSLTLTVDEKNCL